MSTGQACECGGESARAAKYCQWCGSKLRELEDFETRPDDTNANCCPCCGSPPAEVSWQTAPGQSVCDTDGCPVRTWDESTDAETGRARGDA